MSNIRLSPSGKYKVSISELTKTTKFVLSRVNDNKVIYEYDMYDVGSLNDFVTLKNEEWWFGGTEYMLKLFINLDKEEVYNDPNKRKESNAYKFGVEFIWSRVVDVSQDGNKIIIGGCVWAAPYECRLYDISNLSAGYKPYDPYEFFDDIEHNEHEHIISYNIKDENIEDNKYFMQLDGDEKYKFIDNNNIGAYNNDKLIKTIHID